MSLEEPFVLLTAGLAATPALILPLFVVTGASGSGKSTIVSELQRRLPDCVVFDNDLLWGKMGDDMYQFHNNWIRIAYAVAQGERHTVICGTIMPWDLDKAEDRRLLGTVHFVNLSLQRQGPRGPAPGTASFSKDDRRVRRGASAIRVLVT